MDPFKIWPYFDRWRREIPKGGLTRQEVKGVYRLVEEVFNSWKKDLKVALRFYRLHQGRLYGREVHEFWKVLLWPFGEEGEFWFDLLGVDSSVAVPFLRREIGKLPEPLRTKLEEKLRARLRRLKELKAAA